MISFLKKILFQNNKEKEYEDIIKYYRDPLMKERIARQNSESDLIRKCYKYRDKLSEYGLYDFKD